jgi:hypothetical protein
VITDKLLIWWAMLVEDLSFERFTLPGWATSAGDYTGTVFGFGASMGAWFDGALLATVVAAVFASMVLGFTIRLARLGLSITTRGGGA